MAAAIIPIALAAASYFANRKSGQQETQGSQTTNQGTNQVGATSQTPVLSNLQQRLADIFTQGYGDLQATEDLGPYSSVGLQSIAGQGAANRKIISNMLAARGLSFSPAAATPLTQNLLNIGNQMSQFSASIPLLQRQMRQQALEGTVKAFGALPTATTSNFSTQGEGFSHTDQFGNISNFGNPLAGGISGGLAGLFAPNGKGGTNFDDILKMIRGIGGGGGGTDATEGAAQSGNPWD